jgi:dsRNA-specific ribonuclease
MLLKNSLGSGKKKAPVYRSFAFYWICFCFLLSTLLKTGVSYELGGYEFKDDSMARLVLQPRSLEFERLEFLGDRVLNLAIAHTLYIRNPRAEVGTLAGYYAQLVSQPVLTRLYETLHIPLGELYCSTYKPSIGVAKKTSSDIIEALVAAIYLDGGIGSAQQWVDEKFQKIFDRLSNSSLAYSLPTHSANCKDSGSLQRHLGCDFKNESYLHAAFIHPSCGGGNLYNRLGFIGVRVLGFALADRLFKDYEGKSEGLMTSLFIDLLNNDHLESLFKKWELGRYLKRQRAGGIFGILGASMQISSRMAADTLRVLIGSVYLDGGADSTKALVSRIFYESPAPVFSVASPIKSLRVSDLLKTESTLTLSSDDFVFKRSKVEKKEDFPSLSQEKPTEVTSSSAQVQPINPLLNYRQALLSNPLPTFPKKASQSGSKFPLFTEEEFPPL